MKRCTNCGVSKKSLAFGKKQDYRTKNYYLRSQCKACRTKTETIRYQHLTTEQKLKRKDTLLKRLYGIDLNQYNQLFNKQEGKCLGCAKHQNDFKKSLVVDHVHSTKKVRALLCAGCNIALGNVKENPQTLRNLAKYLESNL